jgi:hypothetical protein
MTGFFLNPFYRRAPGQGRSRYPRPKTRGIMCIFLAGKDESDQGRTVTRRHRRVIIPVHERWIMSPIATSVIVFACVFGGALFGLLLRAALPAHHLDDDTKDLMRLGMGLIATMTALLLGLLIASVKSSYDTQKTEVMELSSKIIFLDRALALDGPETREIRNLLRGAVSRDLDRIWPEDRSRSSHLEPGGADGILYDKIQELSPS